MFELLCLILGSFLALLQCLEKVGTLIDREHLFEWLLFVKTDVWIQATI